MAAALPARISIPPEEKARIRESIRRTRMLIDLFDKLPDNSTDDDSNDKLANNRRALLMLSAISKTEKSE